MLLDFKVYAPPFLDHYYARGTFFPRHMHQTPATSQNRKKRKEFPHSSSLIPTQIIYAKIQSPGSSKLLMMNNKLRRSHSEEEL
jgi:hypothetical protein